MGLFAAVHESGTHGERVGGNDVGPHLRIKQERTLGRRLPYSS
jgi:hypothetical protein